MSLERSAAPSTIETQESFWHKVDRELDLLGVGCKAIPSACKEELTHNTVETGLKLAAAAGLGLSFGLLTRSTPMPFIAQALLVGSGVASLGSGLSRSGAALVDNWNSDKHWQQNAEVMQHNFAPFAFDAGLNIAGNLAGGLLGQKLSLRLGSDSTAAMRQTTSITNRSYQPRYGAVLGSSEHDRVEPLSVKAVRVATDRPAELLRLQPGLDAIKRGEFSSPQAAEALQVHMQIDGKKYLPPWSASAMTADEIVVKTGIEEAIKSSKLDWSSFDQVHQAIGNPKVPFGWWTLENIPAVREFTGSYKLNGRGFTDYVENISKYKPESLQPIREMFATASAADRPKFVEYFKAKWALEKGPFDTMVMAYCDKWPAHESLWKEFQAVDQIIKNGRIPDTLLSMKDSNLFNEGGIQGINRVLEGNGMRIDLQTTPGSVTLWQLGHVIDTLKQPH